MSDFKVFDADYPVTHRLIAQAHMDEPAIAPLYDDPEEKAVLDALEGETSGRLVAQYEGLGAVTAGELKTEAFGYGWSFVNAAFIYTRAGGGRFNDEERGAWYAALSLETCIAEVAFHIERELKNTGTGDNRTDYGELLAHLAGRMADLKEERGRMCLEPDIARGYPAGQAVAKKARGEGLDGLVYPSMRDEDGTCIAALQVETVRSVTRGKTLRMEWREGERSLSFQ